MPKYISGRYKKVPLSQLREDRYRYLSPGEAEPSLGDPIVGPSSIGAKPVVSGQQYIIVGVEGYPGERYWIPNQGGIIPGSISVFDEDNLVGGLSSITQLNFIGNAIEATSSVLTETTLTLKDSETFSFSENLIVTQDGNSSSGVVKFSTVNSGIVTLTNVSGSFDGVGELSQDSVAIGKTPTGPGVIDTITNVSANINVSPPGTDNEVLFKDSGDFATDSTFTFDSTENLLAAGDRITVGTGGTVITTLGIGSVGIGTTLPVSRLHVEGDLKLSGTIIDRLGNDGETGYILVKESDVLGGLKWTNPNAVQSGAGGTYGQIQYHGSTELVEGAANFYYDEGNQRVGIGSTQPTQLLDVLGISTFSGGVFIDNLSVSGFSTFNEKVIVEKDIDVDGHTELDNLNVSGFSTFKSNVDIDASVEIQNDLDVDGHTEVDDFQASGISTFTNNQDNTLGNVDTGAVQVDGGVGIAKNLTVGAGISAQYLYITGVATIKQFDFEIGEFEYIKVTGVSTLGNVEISNNDVTTTTGNLTLKADSTSTVQVDSNNKFLINSNQNSISKDTGALVVEGGVGIEKDLYVGGNTNLGDSPTDNVSFAASVSSNIIPSGTRDLGSESFPWDNVYANTFSGSIENANYATRAGLATDVEINGTNQLLYQSSNNDTQVLPTGTSGQILQSNGNSSAPSWITVGDITAGNANYATRAGLATDVEINGTNQLLYQSSNNDTQVLPTGTSGQILQSNGNSSAPSWITVGDISAGIAETANNIAGGDAGHIPYQDGPGSTVFLSEPSGITNPVLTYSGSAPQWSELTNLSGVGYTFISRASGDDVDLIISDGTTSDTVKIKKGNNISLSVDSDSQFIITATTGGSSVTDFLDLGDTPSSYTGEGGKIVAVKSDVSGLEFITAPSGGNLTLEVYEENTSVGTAFTALRFVGDSIIASDVGSGIASIRVSVDYSNVSNTPTIPSDISDLSDNDDTIATSAANAGFITGITVKNENGGLVGFAGSITELDFDGSTGVTIVEKTPNSGIASIKITGGGGGGATALNDLTDVTISTPQNGEVLKYNGSGWVNDTDATSGLNSIELKQYADENVPRTEYGCSNPIEVTTSSGTATIGIGSTSNAYGKRYIQSTDPASGGDVCDGDIWYDTTPSSGGGGGGSGGGDVDVGSTGFFINQNQLTVSKTVSSGDNAGVFGPYAIANGVTLTIDTGATFTVV